MTRSFDAIIIGSGQAGPSLAARLADAGHAALLVERKRLGGTCVNTGCMPTKTLVASARAAYVARRAADYGVSIGGPVTVDMKAVKARKDAIVEAPARASPKWLERKAEPDSIRPRALRRRRTPLRWKASARGAADLHQRRRPRDRARHAGPRPGAVPDQFLDDGRGRPARAPGRRRRQLYRARVRADLPAVRHRA